MVKRRIDLTDNGKQRETEPKRSTFEVVRAIADDTSTLIRKEIELARHEVLDAITARLKAAGALALAGVFALLGLVFGGLAAAAALRTAMPAWAAALILGGAFFLLAGMTASFALLRLKRPSMMPEETFRTMKEDVEWTKQQLAR